MFFKKKQNPSIDDQQILLVENAQNRIRQKRRLYYHFIAFLFINLVLVIINIGLDYGETIAPFGYPWVFNVALLWLVGLLLHTFQVFVTHRFMGKAWEQEQIKLLVGLQEARIEKIKRELDKEASIKAQSEWHQEPQTSQRITMIAAVSTNHALGKDNQLIWHLSDDLKHFKNLTKGHHVIMGRKTFESMPKALPNRTNVVITRQPDYSAENAVVVSSLADAVKVAQSDSRPFIIGGGEIYAQAMEIAHEIELTRVHGEFEADTFFPEIDLNIWEEVWREEHPTDEKHDYAFSFIRYQRK
ncbi:MAG: dihydrofolate reductase [Flavobacteriaceae bacterium]|nr:dihydrofolate reductase [Flavobacteriaceae bacterium]